MSFINAACSIPTTPLALSFTDSFCAVVQSYGFEGTTPDTYLKLLKRPEAFLEMITQAVPSLDSPLQALQHFQGQVRDRMGPEKPCPSQVAAVLEQRFLGNLGQWTLFKSYCESAAEAILEGALTVDAAEPQHPDTEPDTLATGKISDLVDRWVGDATSLSRFIAAFALPDLLSVVPEHSRLEIAVQVVPLLKNSDPSVSIRAFDALPQCFDLLAEKDRIRFARVLLKWIPQERAAFEEVDDRIWEILEKYLSTEELQQRTSPVRDQAPARLRRATPVRSHSAADKLQQLAG